MRGFYSMEKLKTRNEYVGCNRKCRFYADEIEATSYGYWVFVKKINGKVIFNDYKYSHTTRRHQDAVKILLDNLGIKIDAVIYTSESLSDNSFKNDALDAFYKTICRLMVENNTPRIRKKTKEKNKCTIKRLKERIKLLKDMGAVYSMSRILKHYKYYKNERDVKEKFLKNVKKYKNKIVTNKQGHAYQVKSYDTKNIRVELKPVSVGKDRSRRFTKTVYWTWFSEDYKINPLLNAVNA